MPVISTYNPIGAVMPGNIDKVLFVTQTPGEPDYLVDTLSWVVAG